MTIPCGQFACHGPRWTCFETYNSTAAISTYLDLSTLASSGLIPVSTGGAKPFTAVPMTNRTAGITGYADKRVTPYIQSFNLNVQREIARNLTLDVSWIGNKATKLFSGTQLNDTNIFTNGFLDAFNTVRAGGTSPLMDRLFPGGSAALRTNTLGTVGFRTTNTADLVGTLPNDFGKVEKGATIVQYFGNLNRPVWGRPTTNINSTNFGRITTATGNRTITFNARVDF